MITRRTVLAAGLGAAAVASSVSSGNTQTAQRTFVLVHGGWHGGWCWRRVADSLRRQGHTVFTPTLTGLGERSHLMSRDINLDTHITDVVNVFKWEDLERGEVSLPAPTAATFDVNEKDRSWVDSKITPQPLGVLLQPGTEAAPIR